MTFDNDLSFVYRRSDPHCVPCIKPAAGGTVYVHLNLPDQMSLDNRVVSAEAVIRGRTTDLASLNEDDVVKVDGTDYAVKFSRKIEDGLITEVFLKGT